MSPDQFYITNSVCKYCGGKGFIGGNPYPCWNCHARPVALPPSSSGAPPSPAPPIFHDEIAHGSEECGVLPVVIDESIPRGEVHFRNKVTGALVGKIINMMAETRPPVASPLPEPKPSIGRLMAAAAGLRCPKCGCESVSVPGEGDCWRDCGDQTVYACDKCAHQFPESEGRVPPVALPTGGEPESELTMETIELYATAFHLMERWSTSVTEPNPLEQASRQAFVDARANLLHRLNKLRSRLRVSQTRTKELRVLYEERVSRVVELEDDLASLRSRLSAVQSAHRLSVSCAGSVLSKLEAAQADLASLRSRLTEAETERDRAIMNAIELTVLACDKDEITKVPREARSVDYAGILLRALTSAKEPG